MIWIFRSIDEAIMATVRSPATSRRVVLYNIDWRGYCAIGRILTDRPGLRLTYDRGVLEIMTTSPEHERFKRLIDRLLTAWVDDMGIAMTCLGSMTFKRRKDLRGLEPDQCYWVAHEAEIRGKNQIDFRVDPPPDLVLEIDISRRSVNRMAIYGAMGVPEVWRYRKQKLSFVALQPDGRYADVPRSLALPPLTPGDLTPFLVRVGAVDETALVRQFRGWIQQTFPAGGAAPPAP
jgi:Uma2 family endonuclease